MVLLLTFPPISDHKPLLIKGKCYSLDNSDNSFSLSKKTVKWDRLKCINKKELIFDNNYFSALEEVIPDTDISNDDVSMKFISISFNIVKGLNITSMSEVRKSFYHMSQKIFNLKKFKLKLYKAINGRCSNYNLDEFEKLIEKYNKMYKIINHVCNIYRKAEYQRWINTECEYMKSHNPKKARKWLKATTKVDKFKNMSISPVKDKNGKLATSTKEQLEVWHNHYKNLHQTNLISIVH